MPALHLVLNRGPCMSDPGSARRRPDARYSYLSRPLTGVPPTLEHPGFSGQVINPPLPVPSSHPPLLRLRLSLVLDEWGVRLALPPSPHLSSTSLLLNLIFFHVLFFPPHFALGHKRGIGGLSSTTCPDSFERGLSSSHIRGWRHCRAMNNTASLKRAIRGGNR
ncbi:hypothetical protein VUR80DRAFT_462 [Thermomyces stellatus]